MPEMKHYKRMQGIAVTRFRVPQAGGSKNRYLEPVPGIDTRNWFVEPIPEIDS